MMECPKKNITETVGIGIQLNEIFIKLSCLDRLNIHHSTLSRKSCST